MKKKHIAWYAILVGVFLTNGNSKAADAGDVLRNIINLRKSYEDTLASGLVKGEWERREALYLTLNFNQPSEFRGNDTSAGSFEYSFLEEASRLSVDYVVESQHLKSQYYVSAAAVHQVMAGGNIRKSSPGHILPVFPLDFLQIFRVSYKSTPYSLAAKWESSINDLEVISNEDDIVHLKGGASQAGIWAEYWLDMEKGGLIFKYQLLRRLNGKEEHILHQEKYELHDFDGHWFPEKATIETYDYYLDSEFQETRYLRSYLYGEVKEVNIGAIVMEDVTFKPSDYPGKVITDVSAKVVISTDGL